MAQTLILTLDAGTTGIKCAVFGRDGMAQYTCNETYPTYYPKLGWSQQRPLEQLEAALRVIRQAAAHVPVKDIAALVFTGTMNGCIPIDEKGDALYDNIIHEDVRAADETASILRAIPFDAYYQKTGNRIDIRSGLPKYLWLKAYAPDVYQQAFKFVNIKDYLYGKLTGLAGRTDRSDASLCHCLNMARGEWAWDILRELGVDESKMPEIRDCTDVTGRLNAEYARLTGLPAGLPIAIGAGDGACAAHGARRHTVGDAYMNIGSSAWVSSMSPMPVFDKDARIFNYFDLDSASYNVCGTVQCGAAAFNWALKNLIYPGQPAAAWDFDALEKRAQAIAPGAEGVYFLPTLMGERTPWWTTKASGTLIGLTLYHASDHIVRAVYEGVMQALCTCGAIFEENGMPLSNLTLIGGGAQSRLWGQMAASMFGVPARIHATPHEATSMGAAFAAGVGIGLYKDFHEAAEQLRIRQTYLPDAEEHRAYTAQAAVYRKLYPAMKDAYASIHDYQCQAPATNEKEPHPC